MVFDNLLDPVLGPLLGIPTLYAVLLLSFVISLIVTLIYKYTTDQNLMKQLKEEMKEFQKRIKELRKEPEKAMEVQKRAMQTNMKYMMQSMKSTLYSFLPIILIFGWMNANFAFVPIQPGEEFVTNIMFEDGVSGSAQISVGDGLLVNSEITKEIQNNEAKWLIEGDSGEYLIEYDVNGKMYSQEILIDDQKYNSPEQRINDGTVKSINAELEKNIVLNLFGWKLGWLGTYIITAIVFSIAIRRIIKVY